MIVIASHKTRIAIGTVAVTKKNIATGRAIVSGKQVVGCRDTTVAIRAQGNIVARRADYFPVPGRRICVISRTLARPNQDVDL